MAENTVARKEPSLRKCNKPLMEKRRRARINECLSQLKTLVLHAMKKDTSQFSKLEKADILELTVKHLRGMQRQQISTAMATDPSIANKYRAGFTECANEVMRYLGATANGVDEEVRGRLVGHLAKCVQTVNTPAPTVSQRCLQPIHVQIPPQATSMPPTPPQDTPLTSVSLPQNSGMQSQSPTSLGYQGQITGAFQIVPSNLCGGSAVAVYVGAPNSANVTPAMPVYSLQVPSSTASTTSSFVPPPPPSSDFHKGQIKAEVKDSLCPLNLKTSSKMADNKIGFQPYVTAPCSKSAVFKDEDIWRPW